MDKVNSVFIDACLKKKTPYTPIWLMRQAGRYLPEYRALRTENRMLEICQNPDLVTEVTLQPLRRFALDAAILFSDITVPFLGVGIEYDLVAGVGPVVKNPLRTAAEISTIADPKGVRELEFISQSVIQLKKELKVPLIGFGGAPFTLATYLVEGRPSRDYRLVRKLIYSDPTLWNNLMETLSEVTYNFLAIQAEAGADALQLFDSWVGVLPAAVYKESILPHTVKLFERLKKFKLPLIHFAVASEHLYPLFATAGSDVVGLDWTVSIKNACSNSLSEVTVQGNLDPAILFAPKEKIKSEVKRILAEASESAAGHIFNLGHGVLQETPVDNVAYLVDCVHEESSR